MKLRLVVKFLVPVLSFLLVFSGVAPYINTDSGEVYAEEGSWLTKEVVEKVDPYVELESSDSPYDEIVEDDDTDPPPADDYYDTLPSQPGKKGGVSPTSATTDGYELPDGPPAKYYRYVISDENMQELESELSQDELTMVEEQLIVSNNNMREFNFNEATVSGNKISYSYTVNTESSSEPGQVNHCYKENVYCPDDLGLGDPELGETGLELRWDGFTVSLSEHVVGAILGVTGTYATEYAIAQALAYFIVPIPAWILYVVAALLVAYFVSKNTFSIIGTYNYNPYGPNWSDIEST